MPASFPARKPTKDRLGWALASTKQAASDRSPCAPNFPQPESHSEGAQRQSIKKEMFSSLRFTIQLYILIPYRYVYPLFMFPILCKAADVVEGEKAWHVDNNLIRGPELVPSGREVNVCKWRRQGAGR